MRWKALLVAAMLVLSGCVGGGSDDAGLDNESQSQSINATTASNNSTTQNVSDNATYLKNEDYNSTHVHDYWPGNATEKLLMDAAVDTNWWIRDPTGGDVAVGGAWFSLPNGSFVPLGTGKLIVEVDATGALKRGQQQFSYKAANSGSYTEMDPQGAKATWEIDVAPEMTDLPHAKSTQWDFILQADGVGAVMDGEVNVKITAVKTRDLEAWPEHPDFWNGGNLTKLGVANVNATYDRADLGFEYRIGDHLDSTSNDEIIQLPEGSILPPETKVLLVKLWFARNTDPKNAVNGDVELAAERGSSSHWYQNLDWCCEVKEEPGYKMYAVPVDGASWDSPYAEQSAWTFKVKAPSGINDTPATNGGFAFGLTETGSGNVTLDLTAYRVVPPWLDQMMNEDEDDDRSARHH